MPVFFLVTPYFSMLNQRTNPSSPPGLRPGFQVKHPWLLRRRTRWRQRSGAISKDIAPADFNDQMIQNWTDKLNKSTLKWQIHFYPFLDNLDDRKCQMEVHFYPHRNEMKWTIHHLFIIHHLSSISIEVPWGSPWTDAAIRYLQDVSKRLVSRCFQVFKFSILGLHKVGRIGRIRGLPIADLMNTIFRSVNCSELV